MFEIKFTEHALKDLEKISRDIQKRIIKKLTFFAAQEDPILFAKPLVNLPPLTHRFRVGDYRVAFYVSAKILYIDRIRHRREVYKSSSFS